MSTAPRHHPATPSLCMKDPKAVAGMLVGQSTSGPCRAWLTPHTEERRCIALDTPQLLRPAVPSPGGRWNRTRGWSRDRLSTSQTAALLHSHRRWPAQRVKDVAAGDGGRASALAEQGWVITRCLARGGAGAFHTPMPSYSLQFLGSHIIPVGMGKRRGHASPAGQRAI